ncbi:WhiB family transcriptional regulator [Streptomyces sp. IBSNAI002]|uniref:WhiB family transcriptional regulator n=1 Tax=Streptomyces sp. IBSNAI002 TaxID=3457500 RepID=UPI003FCF88DD
MKSTPQDQDMIGAAGTEFDWDGAVCAQIDPELFFPELGGTTHHAKAACARCPRVQQCLDYALSNDERYGVWGGLSVRERHTLVASARRGTGRTAGSAEHLDG